MTIKILMLVLVGCAALIYLVWSLFRATKDEANPPMAEPKPIHGPENCSRCRYMVEEIRKHPEALDALLEDF